MGEPGGTVTTASILRELLARKTSRNPSYSLRAFARDLRVSHTYLSLVMSGKKTLAPKRAILFPRLLGLDSREEEAFLAAVTRENNERAFAGSTASANRAVRKLMPKA